MPMSADAIAAVRAVVEWNPYGARMLLAILRERPAWVRRKDDPREPLHLIQHAVPPLRVRADGRRLPSERPPFPTERSVACARFGQEWRRGAVGTAELADAVARSLATLPSAAKEDGG